MNVTNELAFLIPIVQPIVVRYLKPWLTQGLANLSPELMKLILALVQPLLGALAAYLTGVADLQTGAALGAAAIGVRDGTKRAVKAVQG